MKIVTFEDAKMKISDRFPNQPFELLEYTQMTKPCSIKCLKCGTISNYATLRGVVNKGTNTKQYLCKCYNIRNNNYKHDINKEQIKYLCEENSNLQFIGFGYNDNTKKYTVKCLCKTCNQIFTKRWQDFLSNQSCPFCQNKQLMNAKGFQCNLPDEYTLVSEYTDCETPILIRHNCGFIWKVKPHYFIEKINRGYTGCPKCSHKQSQGEKAITCWLKDHNILFSQEHIFEWQSNPRFRYDFYLPEQNTVIEYMGQQHYYEVDFFHDTLAERQEHDRIKREEALNHNIKYLEICYKDFKNINSILDDWFNDYPEKE